MNTQTITLIAALLAAITSSVNIFFGYLGTSSIEREKLEHARESEKRKELRKAVEAFAEELAKGIWQATWLLWHASQTPSHFSENNIVTYNEEVAKILPRLLTTRVLVAAHDTAVYEQLTELANRFYQLDVDIAVASARFRSSRNEEIGRNAAAKQLGALYNEAYGFHKQLGEKLAAIYSSNVAKVLH